MPLFPPLRWVLPLLPALSMSIGAASGEEPVRIAMRGSAAELFDPSAPPLPLAQPILPAPTPTVTTTPRPSGDAGRTRDPLENPIWAGVKSSDRERRKLASAGDTDWGYMKSEFIWQAPEPGRDTPFEKGAWSTEDLFAVPLSGPLYVFTEVAMDGQFAADASMKVVGRTGVLCRLPVGEGPVIEVRGGPSVKYNDAYKVEKGKEQGAMLWEFKARAPGVIGPFGLEYNGEALPSLTPEERGQLKQDLSLFLPVSGGAGKLKFGAKHRWEGGQQEARSTSTLMQLYLGLEIGR